MKRNKFKKPDSLSEENFELLKDALAYLSPKQRLVVYLRFWDNMTIQEIGRYIGHSWSSTDKLIDGAVNHLRLRIIQLTHAREESNLLNQFCSIAA
jgi:DNA-directed RNA polymerase specialized sigma24 family protein